jgi:hypothetical protein
MKKKKRSFVRLRKKRFYYDIYGRACENGRQTEDD